MEKNKIIIKITVLLLVVSGFCSCADDDYLSVTKPLKENQFVLKLPEKRVIDITTRSGSTTNSVQNILAAVIRSDKAFFEYVSDGITLEDGVVKCTLNKLAPKAGEEVHFFCNVGDQSNIEATTEEDLLKSVMCGSGTTDVMYGTASTGDIIQVNLKHSLANVKVTIDKNLYIVNKLLVCDVPQNGFASGRQYATSEVEDVEFENSDASIFIVPRPDNNNSDITTTFLLMEVEGKGWYRMDFYNNDTLLKPGKQPDLLQINSDVFYHFNISSIKNAGYSSSEEARNNIGSNIVYNLTVDDNVSSSNGQYALLADRDEILLYPNKPGGAINISASILSGNITTYKAQVFSKHDHVKILNSDNDTIINLIQSGDGRLTTGNSNRTIELSSDGAWIQGDYLEITLGNIKKKIPFKLLTANSYLFDCSKSQNVIKIPYLQANSDGKMRINKGDIVTCELLWADRPDARFDLNFDDTKGWVEVKSQNPAFFGNAVIVAKVNGNDKIAWSWHLWCMDNSDNSISYDENTGLYNYNNRQSYCNYEWMDRNLGAYNNKRDGDPGTRGLLYQWGRKDPFNAGGKFPDFLYVANKYDNENSIRLPEAEMYTARGVCTMWDVANFKANEFPGTDKSMFYTFPSGASNETCLELSIELPFAMLSDPVPSITSGGWRPSIDKYSWNTLDGKKTAFDPCPVGWRVPVGVDPNGPWYNLSVVGRPETSHYGMVFPGGEDGEIYYPFVPQRGYGLLYSVDTKLDDGKGYHFYNRFAHMLWADTRTGSRTFPGASAFTDLDGIEGIVNGGATTHIRYAYFEPPIFAASVRCVREK